MGDPREVGVTNMGDVPNGMSFIEATAALPLKYRINPDHHSGRMTLCETMREIVRVARTIPEPQRSQIKLLAAAGYHYGKCMDRRMKELKAGYTCSQ